MVPESGQLSSRLRNPLQVDSGQACGCRKAGNFGRIRRDHVKAGAALGIDMGTKLFVRCNGRDFGTAAGANLELGHDVGIGITGPGEHLQRRDGGRLGVG
jgi:hypothetical protein